MSQPLSLGRRFAFWKIRELPSRLSRFKDTQLAKRLPFSGLRGRGPHALDETVVLAQR